MISDYGKNFLCNLTTRQTTMPATLYIALLTGYPTTSWNGTQLAAVEPSGGGYIRKSISMNATEWSVGANGSTYNNNIITWTGATTAWGTITGFAFCTGSSGGYWLWGGSFRSPSYVGSGEGFYVQANGIVVSFGEPEGMSG